MIQIAVCRSKIAGIYDFLFLYFGHGDQVESEEGEDHSISAMWTETIPTASVLTPLEAGEEESLATFPALGPLLYILLPKLP